MEILIKLILAHLIGDFLLQPASWVKAKEEKKLGAWQLYAHVLLHGVVTLVLVWDISFLKWALLVMASHLIIDGLKLKLQKEHTKRIYFYADQVLHVIALYAVAVWYAGVWLKPVTVNSANAFLFITCIVFLTTPVSIAIKYFIARWTPHTTEGEDDSLESAGKYIGILERLFVFAFFALGHPEGIGFLIAAKSIFRFGDLKEAKSRKLTEYVLIGTLISFGLAILTGIVFVTLKQG
jgi:hypothetical protein